MVNIIGPYKTITKITCDHDDDDEEPPPPPEWNLIGECTLLSSDAGVVCCNTVSPTICTLGWSNYVYATNGSLYGPIFDSTSLGLPPGQPQSRYIVFREPGLYKVTILAVDDGTCAVASDGGSPSPIVYSTIADRFAVSTVQGQGPDYQEVFQQVNKIPDGEEYYIFSDSLNASGIAGLFFDWYAPEQRYQYGTTKHSILIRVYRWG